MPVGLSERIVGQVTILKPAGRIDSQSSPEFETAVTEKLNAARGMILDFTDVPYISSAGLRIVLLIAKKMSGAKAPFALAALKPEILSVFKISGLASVLRIFDDADAALAALGNGTGAS